MSIQVAISGITGKMGQALRQTMDAFPELILRLELGRASATSHRQSTEEIQGIQGLPDADIWQEVDVLIDFTRPEATMDYLAFCVEHQVAMMIGTTGFTPPQKEILAQAAQTIPILLAPNTSLGANLLLQLTAAAAKALGTEYDVEIMEVHHRHKVDAPSGTALRLGEVVAAAKNLPWPEVAAFDRANDTRDKVARARDSIGFSVLRGGDVVGEHTVWLIGAGERIELTHRVTNRQTFAHGALAATKFLAGKPPGLYDMLDVLGLR